MPLSDVCRFQYGTSRKSIDNGSVVVCMGNLQDGRIVCDKLVYSNDERDNEKYFLHQGDVLFTRTNSSELICKNSIYKGEMPAIFAGYLIRLNYTEKLIGDYLKSLYLPFPNKPKSFASWIAFLPKSKKPKNLLRCLKKST